MCFLFSLQVPTINSSETTKQLLNRFFNADLITYNNIKPSPIEAQGETRLELLSDVLNHMVSSDMFATGLNVEEILNQCVSSNINKACDDVANVMDTILSSLTFDSSTEKKTSESYAQLFKCLKEQFPSDSEMMASTSNILGRHLMSVLQEIVQSTAGAEEDLHIKWKNFWKDLFEATFQLPNHHDGKVFIK